MPANPGAETMNEVPATAVAHAGSPALSLNRVLRQTYTLLAMVMAVAATGAGVGVAMGMPWNIAMWLVFMVVFIGGAYALERISNSQASIGFTLAWAGVVGFLFSGIVGAYLSIPGGGHIVFNALATTALLFGALSMYAVTTKKDFSFLTGFMVVGLVLAIVAIIANIFLQIPLLSLVISAAVTLLMCVSILWQTSRMVNGGETNPVTITVSLFSSIVVLFSHLLHLFSVLSGDD
jgi:modulator of FtsH protease